ncbi:hypothetical protein EWB00_001110 [Schistosoma japonicum]|uniref:Uncharacterized protein n=1 Tax=Schistosoma japonicum TaxID=6182 RepID=A0A4Z2DGV5_SCHJA|nr:hypothetical protein EWB00_001110 [Schistosoma japonicum]
MIFTKYFSLSGNLDDTQNQQNSQEKGLGWQVNNNTHCLKDDFEDPSSHPEDFSSFWTSLRSIWKHTDREEFNMMTERDDDHNDESKINSLLCDISDITEYLTTSLCTSGKLSECDSLSVSTLKTASTSVKQLVNKKNKILDKQSYLIDFSEKVKYLSLNVTKSVERLFLNVKNSISSETNNCTDLPATSFNNLKYSIVFLRNNFRKLTQESGNRDEFISHSNVLQSSGMSSKTGKLIMKCPNRYKSCNTGSTLSIHMKFRTPLSTDARKPNIRSVPRPTSDLRYV